jgi:uncharacterized protein YjbI with pentapeptide repeats
VSGRAWRGKPLEERVFAAALTGRGSAHFIAAMNSTTQNANLEGAVFINTSLSGAQFTDVNLGAAQFVDVNLAGARLEDVSLIGVTIENANCTDLSITHARYDGMRIDGIMVSELLRVYRERQGS